jgi:hypothetical protein
MEIGDLREFTSSQNPVVRCVKRNEGADCPSSVVDWCPGLYCERKLECLGAATSSVKRYYWHVVFDNVSLFQNDDRESLEEYVNTTEKI